MDYAARLFLAGIKLVGEVGGYLIADFRMTPNTLVKHLDVFKDHLPGLLPGSEAIMMQAFRFECTKVCIFSHSICISFFTPVIA